MSIEYRPSSVFSRGKNKRGKSSSSSNKYQRDDELPKGWTFLRNGRGTTFFKTSKGLKFTSRRKALAYMQEKPGFSKEEIYYVRDGLLDEGWFYHEKLPPSWMYKQYTHKIEGVDTEILYLLAPDGTLLRSLVKIKECAEKFQLTEADLQLVLAFMEEQRRTEERRVENPDLDSDWIYDEQSMPPGWRVKEYSYYSKVADRKETVYHYLTPEKSVVRGRKQIYEYLKKRGTYNDEDFNKFRFVNDGWTVWKPTDLKEGWEVRQHKVKSKTQYKSPDGKKFSSRLLAMKHLKAQQMAEFKSKVKKKRKPAAANVVRREMRSALQQSNTKHGLAELTVWDEWRSDEIPCLQGWKFSIGRLDSQRKIRYKSPSGEVFASRGPLLRYLRDNRLKSREQLLMLKKQLKTNQGLSFGELRRNDKFIKSFDVDHNYLAFLRIRYHSESHADIPEEDDPKLPAGWKKKVINDVAYFKDPTGQHVFNSRKLVVEHLRNRDENLSRSDLLSILEESESDSDLTVSEEESDEKSSMNNNVF